MAKSASYRELKIGDKFLYGPQSKVYQKVVPVKKNCCRMLYNSIGMEDANDRIIVPYNIKVQIFELQGDPPDT